MQVGGDHRRPIELDDLGKMERTRNMNQSRPAYAPLLADEEEAEEEEEEEEDAVSNDGSGADSEIEEHPFAWVEYSIFLLLGVAMLWAWYE
jgi:hypothetical protein